MVNIAVIVGYLIFMLAVSAYFARSESMSEGRDCVLAGQTLPAIVVAGTLLTTFVGSGSVIGACLEGFVRGFRDGASAGTA